VPAVDGDDELRLARPRDGDEAPQASAAAQLAAPAAPDRDDGLGSGVNGVPSAEDGEVGPLPYDLEAGLLEAVAPAVEAVPDEDRARSARQEEPDVCVPQAQRRISR
jgi:hypothetical protein